MTNAVWVYDCELRGTLPKVEIIKWFRTYCKKWAFQLEEGSQTCYIHYQVRFSLIKKLRAGCLLKRMLEEFGDGNIFHLTPTSDTNYENNFYVIKKYTRIDGPWTDKDPPVLTEEDFPIQSRIQNPYPWQICIAIMLNLLDMRHINVISEIEGGVGKSSFLIQLRILGYGIIIPPLNDMKEMMGVICSSIEQSKKKPKNIFIDFPRALSKEKLNQFFSAVETIKSGYAYDTRYKYREHFFDSPNIFIFMNEVPNINLLSKDRWKFFNINEKFQLIRTKDGGIGTPSRDDKHVEFIVPVMLPVKQVNSLVEPKGIEETGSVMSGSEYQDYLKKNDPEYIAEMERKRTLSISGDYEKLKIFN